MPPPSDFTAIGTRWRIDTAEALAPAVLEEVLALCERFDRSWSRFRTDSLVHRMSVAPGSYDLPAEAPALMDLYRDLYEATDGAVNPLVGHALEQLGYDRAYSLRPTGAVVTVPRWEDAVSWDGRALHTRRPVVLDIGAAGKGYLADLVGEELRHHGIGSFTVDASGDILHAPAPGSAPLRVALEHPADPTRAIGVARLAAGALCASASNRRAWPGAHHILDALTGRPTADVVAAWAIAPTALVADGLATALFVADPVRLEERFEMQWVRMTSLGRIETSAGFDGEVFA
jgi:thiamine biosynthesis lipoprotein